MGNGNAYKAHKTFLKQLQSKWNKSASEITVLDMGCGGGEFVVDLYNEGYNVFGYDLSIGTHQRTEEIKMLKTHIGNELADRIKLTDDERKIPFSSGSFDIIVSSAVLEHIKYVDDILFETHRVLREGGCLMASLPYKSSLMEQHIGIPLAHRFKQGRFRISYIQTLKRCEKKKAIRWDKYLAEGCYYRYRREIKKVGLKYFEACKSEVNLLREIDTIPKIFKLPLIPTICAYFYLDFLAFYK